MKMTNSRINRTLSITLSAVLGLSPAFAGSAYSIQAAVPTAEHIASERAISTDTASGNMASENIASVTQEELAATETSQEVISISSAGEFIEFAQNCTFDTYSKGKTFVLTNDIKFINDDFVPAATFCGIFDGQGYTIDGVSIHQLGTDLGMFRFVEEGALVKNLNVKVNINPTGSKDQIGGIAGTNRGTIINCSVDGNLRAESSLGGVAGYNEKTGLIENCENRATLVGNDKIGGIVGNNEGTINNCTNRGAVNDSEDTVSDEDKDESTMSFDIKQAAIGEKINDTGGVAGYSSGVIKGSVNYGTIGYAHSGYNTGGIVGRQNGCVYASNNYGIIQGRKDVGGIVGQFEPYLLINYNEDTLQKVQNQVDILLNQADSLSAVTENAGDSLIANADKVKDSLTSIRDISRGYKDYYGDTTESFADDLQSTMDRIQDITNSMELDDYGDQRSDYDDLKDDLDEAQNLYRRITNLRSGTSLKERWNLITRLNTLMKNIARESRELVEDTVDKTANNVDDTKDDLDALRTEANTLSDLIENNYTNLKDDIDNTDEDLTANFNTLYDNMEALGDSAKSSRLDIQNQVDSMRDQLRNIQTTLKDGVDEIRDKIDDDGTKDDETDSKIYDDESDSDDDSIRNGTIILCRNFAEVQSDSNAGGIAGTISIEVSLDPESDVEVEGDRTLNMTRNARATVLSCINRADVTVKNDCAGGIAGRADMGALISNENYSNVETTDGDYVGGIAGRCNYMIRGNYAMGAITGKNYQGGIVGLGKDMANNHAMVVILNLVGEKIGTIAGEADGAITGNVYVKQQATGAVNHVTYENQARAVSYQELVSMEGTPRGFSSITVRFYAEDELIRTMSFKYGDDVTADLFPIVESKPGVYYKWDVNEILGINRNWNVYGSYEPWTTTIATSEKVPILLAESNFHPHAVLSCGEIDSKELPSLSGYNVIRGYSFEISEPEPHRNTGDNMKLRVLAADCGKTAKAALIQDGKLVPVDSVRDGKYIVFSVGNTSEFAIVEETQIPWLLIAGVGVLGLLLIVIFRKLARRKKQKSESETKPQTEK